MNDRPLVWIVVGARPNFMKAGPVLHALREGGAVDVALIHTGQHYDERMSELFFRDLGLPRPDVNLEVGSGSHAAQTGEVMVRFERCLLAADRRPSMVVVVGDVNSTLAAALVAAKALVRVAHVEAGLRSFDRSMPEELNRICVDQLADLCLVTEASGMRHLSAEGKAAERCHLVGNTMIDSLLRHQDAARPAGDAVRARAGVERGGYVLVTLHRPNNVDDAAPLARILEAVARLGAERPVLWPVHPRTRRRAADLGLAARIESLPGTTLLEPLGYLDFLGLQRDAALVVTDSGGVQEEACVLRVPCVTVRPSTERPVTLEMGGNVLAPADPDAILDAAARMAALDRDTIGRPPLWDGAAGPRVARLIEAQVLVGARSASPEMGATA